MFLWGWCYQNFAIMLMEKIGWQVDQMVKKLKAHSFSRFNKDSKTERWDEQAAYMVLE